MSMNVMMMDQNEDREMSAMIQPKEEGANPKGKKGGMFSGLGSMLGFGGSKKP